jgi:hypothetical protein
LVLCIYKRGSPATINKIKRNFFGEIKNLNIEENTQNFEENYNEIKKEFYSPSEVLKDFHLI